MWIRDRATAEQMSACDYVGITSGNNTPDKMEKAGFHTTKAEFVDAPIIEELPMTLECRLISYDPESCHLFCEIVNVSADERILSLIHIFACSSSSKYGVSLERTTIASLFT